MLVCMWDSSQVMIEVRIYSATIIVSLNQLGKGNSIKKTKINFTVIFPSLVLWNLFGNDYLVCVIV